MRNLAEAGITAVVSFFILFPETVCAENVVFADSAFKAYIVKNFDGKDGSAEKPSITMANSVRACILRILPESNLKHTHLDCSYSPIFTLDVSKNLNLTYLACNGDSLSEMDMSGDTLLKEFYST